MQWKLSIVAMFFTVSVLAADVPASQSLPQGDVAALQAELKALRTQVESLKKENAELKAKLGPAPGAPVRPDATGDGVVIKGPAQLLNTIPAELRPVSGVLDQVDAAKLQDYLKQLRGAKYEATVTCFQSSMRGPGEGVDGKHVWYVDVMPVMEEVTLGGALYYAWPTGFAFPVDDVQAKKYQHLKYSDKLKFKGTITDINMSANLTEGKGTGRLLGYGNWHGSEPDKVEVARWLWNRDPRYDGNKPFVPPTRPRKYSLIYFGIKDAAIVE